MNRVLSTAILLSLNIAVFAKDTNVSSVSDVNSGLSFIENKGQVTDYTGKGRPDVLFNAHNNAVTLFVTATGIMYQYRQFQYPEGYDPRMEPGSAKELQHQEDQKKKIVIKTHRVDMTLLHANTDATISKENQTGEICNYYLANCPAGITGVQGYRHITVQNVYPHIDWVIYSAADGKQEGFTYDFIVHPGGNPSDIQMEYRYANHITLNQDGSLSVANSLGTQSEQKPVSYQDNESVESNFALNGNVVTYKLANYDRQKDLIIDPGVSWATYLGAGGDELGRSAGADAAGNVYMCGNATSTTTIATPGSFQSTYGGGSGNAGDAGDAFLVKFNSNGARQWSTYYGGNGEDVGYFCTLDATGNIYMTGSTLSSNMATAGSHQSTFTGSNGFSDAFLVKFNNIGIRQWATYYGGDNDDWGYGCAIDLLGDVYISGTTGSMTNIASPGSHQTSNASNGPYNGFLAKFNSSGVRQWGTYYGGNNGDYAYGCTTDTAGSVYMCGMAASDTGIATPGSYLDTLMSASNSFLVKFNNNGVRQWGTYFGANAIYNKARSCKVDNLGNVYLTGKINGGNVATLNSHQNNYGGGTYDAYLAKFNGTGALQWATYYGGSDYDEGYACSIDVSNNVYLCGYTKSTTGVATTGSYQSTYGGVGDAFLAQFNSNGVRQWATYYGGNGDDYALSCFAGSGTDVYLVGYTESTNGIATTGALQTAYGGGTYFGDAFLTRFYFSPTDVKTVSAQNNEVIIYPNPATSYIGIKTTERLNIKIINQLGQVINSQDVGAGDKINIASLPDGVYTVYALEYGTAIGKFVKLK